MVFDTGMFNMKVKKKEEKRDINYIGQHVAHSATREKATNSLKGFFRM